MTFIFNGAQIEQDMALNQVKSLLFDPPILQYFDPKTKNVIQADASQCRLGAVLLQKGNQLHICVTKFKHH